MREVADQVESRVPSWGDAPWDIPDELPVGPMPRRCDVAVVGAGLAGLSTAFHLARRGARVVVFETAAIGAGGSGRTGGLVLEGTAVGPLEQVDRCLDAIAAVVSDAGIACDLTLGGCRLVGHEAEAGGRRPAWRDGDQWIVPQGIEPGGTVDPGQLLTGLAAAARAAGAEIRPQAPVQAIATGRDGGHSVRIGAADIAAERIVVALNAYTSQLLTLPRRFRSALTLALCTAPLDASTLDAIGLADRLPFYTLDLPYLWGRCLSNGGLMFGAGLVFPADGDVRSVALDAADAAESMTRLEARVRALHPALAAVQVTHRWGGPIAFPPGGTPILSRVPGAPGVITYAGCAGHGVALSVRVGQLIAAAIADGAALPAWGALE